MFVVNELLIARGRSLDKITQAQTVKTYPGLVKDLAKLAASQYLAEIVLSQALSEHPQQELYELLNEHLNRLDNIPIGESSRVLAYLAHAVFHLLALDGLAPQVQICCLTQNPLTPDLADPHWRVGFSIAAGGIVSLQAWENLRKELVKKPEKPEKPVSHPPHPVTSSYQTVVHRQELPAITARLTAQELAMLQQLSQPEIMQISTVNNANWVTVEQVLRQYAQYHLGRPIRSATLIDSYFAANHDATV
jgi:DNA repair protein RecO (recombination protein O)